MTTRRRWRTCVSALGLFVVIGAQGCGSGPPTSSAGAGGDVDDLVWVARDGGGMFDPDTLIGIDPQAANIERRVGTEDLWSNLAMGAGAFWSAGADLLVRIDPRSGRADSIPLAEGSHPGHILLAEGSLWVANNGDGQVLRIDPARREIIASIQVAEDESIDNGISLAAGGGAIWAIALFGEQDLCRIDPVSNAVTGQVENLGDGVVAVAYGEGSVWAVSVHDGKVHRVDPATLQVQARIGVFNRPVAIAVGEGSVWVVKQSDGTVDRIDPQTNRVVATFPIGGEPGDIIVAHGSVWVLNWGDNSLARINPQANEVTAIVSLGNTPKALAAAQ